MSYLGFSGTGQHGAVGDPNSPKLQQIASVMQALQRDPQAAQALQVLTAQSSNGRQTPQAQRAMDLLSQRMIALGLDKPFQTAFARRPDGSYGLVNHSIFWDTVLPQLMLGAAAVTGLAAGSSLAGAAAGAGTSAAIPTASATPTGAAAIPASAILTPPPAAAAAGGFGTGLTSPAALGLYGTAAQSIVQGVAARSAAKQQQKAAADALALQRDVLNQQQINLSPYMQAGTASLGRLNNFLTPAGQTPANLSAPIGGPFGGGTAGGASILVIAPNGQQMVRPASEAQHWSQLGATVQQTGQAR